MFSTAIVRKPGPSIVNGITTADLGKPVFEKAVAQHEAYIRALEACGLQVITLEADDRFPDGVFIEDVALCTPHCAVISRPGAESRRGETEGIREVLSEFFDHIEAIEAPGTLDAGDVMMVRKHFFIGLSERTNTAGAEQLMDILQQYTMTGSVVPVREALHLKSSISYLENNTILVGEPFSDHPAFGHFNAIEVDPAEAYAANSLWVNGKVLVPAGFLRTQEQLEQAGFETIPLDMSEFQKLDGGLSCLSLRF